MISELLIYLIYFAIICIIIVISYFSSNSDLKGIVKDYNEVMKEYESRNLKPKYESVELKRNFKYQSKGEALCKRALEKYFNKQFNNVRPSWLVNPETGRCLELDCYNDELKVALEYNGIQHYKYPNSISKSKYEFNKQVERDRYKKRVCESRGIKFLVVPYTIKYDDIEDYVIKLLKENNL